MNHQMASHKSHRRCICGLASSVGLLLLALAVVVLRPDVAGASRADDLTLGNLQAEAAPARGKVISSGFTLWRVVLDPPPDGDAVRAMWLYSTAGCQLRVDTANKAQAILDFCAREGVNRIYFHIDHLFLVNTSELWYNLRVFLGTAFASGIRVEALIDGIDTYNDPSGIASHIGRILSQVHDPTPYNTDDDFAAIHFDIEFWLDPDWPVLQEDRQEVARQYLENVLVNARDYLDSHNASYVEIGVDLSAHLNNPGYLPQPFKFRPEEEEPQYFLEHVLDHADDVVLMSYYDSAYEINDSIEWELEQLDGSGDKLQLGAMIQPGHLPINTFADNSPDPYTAMTTELTAFHAGLSPAQLAVLDGFSVFHYDGYSEFAPRPANVADFDDDGDVDLADFAIFTQCFRGPGVPIPTQCQP